MSPTLYFFDVLSMKTLLVVNPSFQGLEFRKSGLEPGVSAHTIDLDS